MARRDKIPTVTGIGQCSLDTIVPVGTFPTEDTKYEVSGWTVQGGGPVATAMVTLARLGVKTRFAGVVGDDEAGALIKKGLRMEGVGIKGVVTRKGKCSQLAFIVANTTKAKRTIFWQRPTGQPLRPSEVDTKSIERSSSFLLIDGLMERASIKAARAAKRAGVPVMLDAGRMRDGTEELASLSDYIVASEEFAVEYGGSADGALKKLARLKPKAATITLGKRGSVTWTGAGTFSQRAFAVKAVDTTGAGDVFHGAYVFGLLRGWEIGEAIRFASAAAALKCTLPGGRAGIADLKTTLALMKRKGNRR